MVLVSGEQKMTLFTTALQLLLEFFSGWSDDEVNALIRAQAGDLQPFCEVLRSRLEAAGAKLECMYVILHDRDKASDHVDSLTNDGLITPHVHLMVGFQGRSNGLTPSRVAEALGIQPQMIEKAKQGGHAKDNCLSYLIHAKDDDKFQYDPRDVVTVVGRDYCAIETERREIWAQGGAKKSAKRAEERVQLIVKQAAEGDIMKNDIISNNDSYETYATVPGAKNAIDTALGAAAERHNMLEVDKLKAGDFAKSTIFIDGLSGTGKSLLAFTLVYCLQQAYGWRCHFPAAKNALDDYSGEEVLLMDDVRGGALSFEDWLKLLDPHYANPAATRYKNKPPIAPRVIIITSSTPPDDFFSKASSVSGGCCRENLDQPIRRILRRVNILNPFGPNGWYNCNLMEPKRHDQPSKWVPQRYWWHESIRQGFLHSPFAVLSELVYLVNERNRDMQLDAGQLQAAIEDGCRHLEGKLQKAVASGDLPPLPPAYCPDGPGGRPAVMPLSAPENA